MKTHIVRNKNNRVCISKKRPGQDYVVASSSSFWGKLFQIECELKHFSRLITSYV